MQFLIERCLLSRSVVLVLSDGRARLLRFAFAVRLRPSDVFFFTSRIGRIGRIRGFLLEVTSS